MNKLLLRRLPINLQRYDRYKYGCSNFIHDDCSQESKKTISSKSQIYDGPFSTKLKWLKRFSVTSSVFSITIFPYLVHTYASAEIALVGKIAIVGTAILSSIGSTIMLKLITGPYVCAIYEYKGEMTNNDRELIVTQLNIFGRVEETTFKVNNIVKVTAAMHPFASFKVNDKYFYVGKDIKDEVLQKKLCY